MKRQFAIVAMLTLASQIAAFIKLWVTAHAFGVGAIVDGYNLALVVPILLSSSLSGIVQTGLFPVRSRIAAAKVPAEVDAFERAILLGVVGLGLALTLLLVLSRSVVMLWVAGDAPPATQGAFAAAFLPLASLLTLNVVGDCAGYLLAMRNKFAIAAGAPIVNGAAGAVILFSFSDGGVGTLVWSTIVGVALQVGICLLGLRFTRLRLLGSLPATRSFAAAVRDMAKLGVWMVPGVVLSNLVLSLPQVWITQYGEGAVSAFGYALRLHLASLQLIVMASSTLLLARFSELVSTAQKDAVNGLLKVAVLASWVVGALGFILVLVIGEPLLNVLLGGKFTSEAAHRVAVHWAIITGSLPFAIMSNIYAKLWQAEGKPFLMTLLSAVNLGCMQLAFWVVGSMLLEYAGAFAFATGASISAVVAVVIEWFRRSRKLAAGVLV